MKAYACNDPWVSLPTQNMPRFCDSSKTKFLVCLFWTKSHYMETFSGGKIKCVCQPTAFTTGELLSWVSGPQFYMKGSVGWGLS